MLFCKASIKDEYGWLLWGIDKGVEAIRREFNIKLVLATMGKNGSKSYCGNAATSMPAYANSNVVDTTGAGDTFMG